MPTMKLHEMMNYPEHAESKGFTVDVAVFNQKSRTKRIDG